MALLTWTFLPHTSHNSECGWSLPLRSRTPSTRCKPPCSHVPEQECSECKRVGRGRPEARRSLARRAHHPRNRSPVFPHIFKARCLSRGWLQRLAGGRSNPGDIAFHNEVTAVSSTWSKFSPLLLRAGCLFGYEPSRGAWRKMTIRTPPGAAANCKLICGSLSCTFTSDRCHPVGNDHPRDSVTVMNVLTGRSRRLECPAFEVPAFDTANTSPFDWLLVNEAFHALRDGFILVVAYRAFRIPHLKLVMLVYDSREAEWIVDDVDQADILPKTMLDTCINRGLFRDSKFVLLFEHEDGTLVLGHYDVLTKEWTHAEVRNSIFVRNSFHYDMIFCGPRILLVAFWYNAAGRENNVYCLEYMEQHNEFLPLHRLEEVFRCPDVPEIGSDEGHIYLGTHIMDPASWQVHAFSLESRRWRALAPLPENVSVWDRFFWTRTSFSPGCNPFFDP